jgi:hypothetical protein
MNKAWLIKRHDAEDDWEIVFSEPDRYTYEVKEIVWAEVTEGAPS